MKSIHNENLLRATIGNTLLYAFQGFFYVCI